MVAMRTRLCIKIEKGKAATGNDSPSHIKLSPDKCYFYHLTHIYRKNRGRIYFNDFIQTSENT